MNLDIRAVGRGHRVTRVECLAARTIHVEIDERNLGCELKIRNLVEHGGADIARPDDDNFPLIDRHKITPLKNNKTRLHTVLWSRVS